MNEQQLRNFLEIYKEKNLRRAADNLYISRQALSKSLQTLEEELGRKLFIRETRGVRPTPAAVLLKPHAETILREFQKMQNHITLSELNENVLTVYAFDGVMAYLTPAFIDRYRKKCPDVLLNVITTSDVICRDALQRGACDCAIVPDSLSLPGGRTAPLFTSHFCVALPSHHPLADKAHITAEDFDHQAMVGKGRSYDSYLQELNYIVGHGIRPNIVFETTDSTLLFNMIAAGKGIAYMWDIMTLPAIPAGVTIRPYKNERAQGELLLAADPNAKSWPAVNRFREIVQKWIRENHLETTDFLS